MSHNRDEELVKLKDLLTSITDYQELAHHLVKHHQSRDIPYDDERISNMVRFNIVRASRDIHDALSNLTRSKKVARFPKAGRGAKQVPRLELKSIPPRKRQLEQLVKAATSKRSGAWQEAWFGLSDNLALEIEEQIKMTGVIDIDHGLGFTPSYSFLGWAPNPSQIIPLAEMIRNNKTTGRPSQARFYRTIALILDEHQFLSQMPSWGIDNSRADNFKRAGAMFAARVLELYDFGKEYLHEEDGVKQDLLEAAREYRQYYAGDKIHRSNHAYRRRPIEPD